MLTSALKIYTPAVWMLCAITPREPSIAHAKLGSLEMDTIVQVNVLVTDVKESVQSSSETTNNTRYAIFFLLSI